MEKKPDMGWDSQIEEAHIIPEKDASGNKIAYDFEVVTFKRNPQETFRKNTPESYCAFSVDIKMNLSATVDGEKVEGTAEDKLILTLKSQFRIFQYFTGIGLRENGSGSFDPVKAKAWEPATNIGETGKCHIRHDVFNGQTRIKIEKYLEPEEIDV
jgi:hypothetical protein